MRPVYEDFATFVLFQDEAAKKVCRKPIQFSLILFGHHVKFRRKSYQKMADLFFGHHVDFREFLHQISVEADFSAKSQITAACSSKSLGTSVLIGSLTVFYFQKQIKITF